MREILFRGIPVSTNGFAYGYLLKCHGKSREYFAIKDTDSNINNGKLDIIPTEVKPKTIGQYTGIKDKTGKKIFDGDIVKVKFKALSKTFTIEKRVVFVKGAFKIGYVSFSERILNLEITGNIHHSKEGGGKTFVCPHCNQDTLKYGPCPCIDPYEYETINK